MKTDNEKYISHVQEARGDYAHVKKKCGRYEKRDPNGTFTGEKTTKQNLRLRVHWMRWTSIRHLRRKD